MVNVDQVVEQGQFGAFQFSLLLLCGLCLIIDGFDVQAMGYVAPAIIADWGVSKASLGPVFGAGLFGMLLGSLVLTPVGDRYGKYRVVSVATVACALGSAASNSAAASGAITVSGGGIGSTEAEWPIFPDCWAASHDSMSSGGTSIRRRAPSITLWNTGADTRPP